jgi:PKHD-type hydroxylase
MLLILPDVLDAKALAFIDEALAGAVFAEGARTAGAAARDIKSNLEMDRERSPKAEHVELLVHHALSSNAALSDHALPRHFSRPIISRYDSGMAYGRHVDNPILAGAAGAMRTDISVTVFLSEPDDYAGGELVLDVAGAKRRVKLPRGHAVAYTTGTPHHVAPVESGARLAAVVWIESMVADPHRRDILARLHRAHHALVAARPGTPETEQVLEAYYDLVRLWARP